MPGRTLPALRCMTLAGTPSDPGIDLELVRMMGCECLSDSCGGLLVTDRSIPTPIANWLVVHPAKDALADFGSWENTLTKAYGKRHYVPCDVEPAAVYARAA